MLSLSDDSAKSQGITITGMVYASYISKTHNIIQRPLMMEKSEDKRKLERSLCYLKAIREDTGEPIGHVGDIHYEGLNLISKNEIPLHDGLRICVETPGEEVKIPLVVKGVWNQMNEEPNHYSTGCQIIDPLSESVEAIYKLVEAFKKGGNRPFKYAASFGA
jgi:hypothetical protein